MNLYIYGLEIWTDTIISTGGAKVINQVNQKKSKEFQDYLLTLHAEYYKYEIAIDKSVYLC